MKIYTKTGDRGKTSLGSGERVWKNSKRVEAYGTLDELNALIGILVSDLESVHKSYAKEMMSTLFFVQRNLFAAQTYLSNPQQEEIISKLPGHTLQLEKDIDAMTEKLVPLTNFILPGGGKIGAEFHLARTTARRAERRIIDLTQEEEVDARVIQYVNRLSDLFFTMARFASFKEKKKEITWSKSIYLKDNG